MVVCKFGDSYPIYLTNNGYTVVLSPMAFCLLCSQDINSTYNGTCPRQDPRVSLANSANCSLYNYTSPPSFSDFRDNWGFPLGDAMEEGFEEGEELEGWRDDLYPFSMAMLLTNKSVDSGFSLSLMTTIVPQLLKMTQGKISTYMYDNGAVMKVP